MLLERLSLFTPLDLLAAALLLVAWAGIGVLIEYPPKVRPSVSILMAEYRRRWMVQMAARENRIFDAQIVGNLRQGTAFFASTCILAIGGVLAMINNAERLLSVAEDLTLAQAPIVIWEFKLLLVVLFLTNGFLRFVWSNRLFGYCSVMMAAVPNEVNADDSRDIACKAAELNVRAAVNFNRGLRSLYFALGALAWLLGAVPLMVATAATLWLVWSREFASIPRKILLNTYKSEQNP